MNPDYNSQVPYITCKVTDASKPSVLLITRKFSSHQELGFWLDDNGYNSSGYKVTLTYGK